MRKIDNKRIKVIHNPEQRMTLAVLIENNEVSYEQVGVAKCHPDNTYDEHIGELLAVARFKLGDRYNDNIVSQYVNFYEKLGIIMDEGLTEVDEKKATKVIKKHIPEETLLDDTCIIAEETKKYIILEDRVFAK